MNSEMIRMKQKLKNAHLIIYTALFFAFWTAYTLLLKPFIETGALGGEIISGLIKLASWTLPAVILMLHFRDDLSIPFPEMLRGGENPRKNLLYTAGVALLMAVSILLGVLIRKGKLGISDDFTPLELVGTVLLVGITEEAVFRGFLLNALLKKTRPDFAVGISSALFVAIHFPIWALDGVLGSGIINVLGGCAQVFMLGVLFSWSFFRSRSLIYPIILHMIWNLLIISLS